MPHPGRSFLWLALPVPVAAAAIAGSGVFDPALTVVSLVVAAACTALAAVRTMAGFVLLILAMRPLLDVGSGPRGSGASVTQLVGVGLIVVLSVWLVRHRVAVWRRFTGDRLSMALAALLVVLMLSTIGSVDPVGSGPFVLRFATGCALYLVVDLLLFRGSLQPRQVVNAAFFAACVALGYSALGLLGLPVTHEKDGLTALKSVFHLSNNFAHFLVPFMVVAAAWSVRARGRRRWVAVAFLVTALVQLMLTETRGAWVAAFVGFIVLGALLDRRLLYGTIGVTLCLVLFVPSVQDRVLTVVPSPEQSRTESSGTWRLQHWGELLPLASDSPVLGVGPDQSVRLTGKEPHNDFLRSYVELGVAGVCAFLWVLSEMVRTARRALRRVETYGSQGARGAADDDDGGDAATVVGLAAYLGALLVALLGENLIDNVTMLIVLMPALALLRHAAESSGAEEQPVSSSGDEAGLNAT